MPRKWAGMAIIYKIFRAEEYAAFVRDGQTDGAPIDVADGYVHMSTAEQVEETAAKHFAGETGLKLLGFESEALEAELRWEPSRGGALFPHLYRALTMDDVLFVHDLPLREGRHRFDGLVG